MTDPDTYVTDQGHALRDALAARDLDRAARIADHVVAEAGVSRDHLLATVLMALAVRATEVGDHAGANEYHRLAADQCSPEAIRTAIAGALLAAGSKAGWLPAEQHDRLAELIEGMDGYAAKLFARIDRRDDRGEESK